MKKNKRNSRTVTTPTPAIVRNDRYSAEEQRWPADSKVRVSDVGLTAQMAIVMLSQGVGIYDVPRTARGNVGDPPTAYAVLKGTAGKEMAWAIYALNPVGKRMGDPVLVCTVPRLFELKRAALRTPDAGFLFTYLPFIADASSATAEATH